MANLWDELDEEQKASLARQAISGTTKTPENMNRARQQLSQNPNLVQRLAKEAGIIDEEGELSNETDVAEDTTLDDTVNASLEDSGDVETPGSLPKTLPPPEEGEDVKAYYNRLSDEIGYNHEKPTPPRIRGYDEVVPDDEPEEATREELNFRRDQQRRRDTRSPTSVVRRR